jgi:archaellum biogenesis ATPase FlaH
MTPFLQQRLARFVDRESEMHSFCSMLEKSDWPRPIMLVWGDGGMGKSALLMKMIHECSLREFRKAEVFWTDTRNHEYLAVMRKIRDDVGANNFVEFTNLVNFFTVPQYRLEVVVGTNAPTTVASGATFGPSSQVGTMAGIVIEKGGIVLKDLMLTDPRNDLGISESDRMARLTDQFVQELNAVANSKKVVIFLDAVEKATDATQRWVWGELLGAVREERLVNVCFVLGGRSQPAIDERWRPLIEEKQLGPLKQEHIVEYLIKRGVNYPNDAARQAVAEAILAFTEGNPFKVASAVEAMSRQQEQKDRTQ